MHINAQTCIEYPNIEGSICEGCVPSGWSIVEPSPGITDPSGTWVGLPCTIDHDGESPGGGNMVLIGGTGGPPAAFESMVTTVSGLDPSLTYSFGVYWHYATSCLPTFNFEPADLFITVDGMDFTFSGSDEWELAEVCIQPSSSSIDITITGSTTNFVSLILVDSAPCEDLTPCCSLVVDIEEEEIDLCSGENYLIPADYTNNQGAVDIEWTSNPSDGVNYLDDVDIIDPTFNFPFSEQHNGESYEFIVTIEDDLCIQKDTIVINVIPNDIPEFEIEPCELSGPNIFYSPSDNGYTGIWNGEFDLEGLGGSTETFVFAIDPNQNNCLEEYQYDFFIEPALELTFLVETIYCELDDNTYDLPSRSEENVDGTWNFSEINPENLGAGQYEYTFTPEDACAYPYILSIEVIEAENLSFDLPISFCSSNEEFVLPVASLESIAGTWDQSTIDLSQVTDNGTVTFTPFDQSLCYFSYEYNYTITSTLNPTWNIADTICRNQTNILELPTSSVEGYTGSWIPNAVLLDTIDVDTVEFTWIAEDMECFNDTSITIYILNEIIYEFDLPQTICINSSTFSLPIASVNNLVTGSWNIPVIDTDNYGPQVLDLEFTPTDTCSSNYLTSIELVVMNRPSFDIDTSLCSLQEASQLPTTSIEGYIGSWSKEIIDPSVDDAITLSTFTPLDPCVEEITIEFTITEALQPEFDLPELCGENYQFIFPTTSINGIEGVWENVQFDSDIHNEAVFENTFTPNDTSCASILNYNAAVLNFDDVITSFGHPSSCEIDDGFISIESNNPALEISIDNGLTWNGLGQFDNLASGSYTILLRYDTNPKLYNINRLHSYES